MNSEEGVSLAKMAVTVLLVVLVISAVVAIVYAAYEWFTSGKDKLSDQVVSIDKSSLSQYDDTQVSGTDVISALKEHREADIAIVIANISNQKANGGAGFDAGANLVSGYNYCARIATNSNTNSNTNTNSNNTDAYMVTLSKVDGQWQTPTNCGLAWEDDKISLKRNTNFSPTTTQGKADQFVKKSANWYANLIYDSTTGDVCGILFRQMN